MLRRLLNAYAGSLFSAVLVGQVAFPLAVTTFVIGFILGALLL